MKKVRFLSGAAAVLLLLFSLLLPCSASEPPVIDGNAAILIERNSGQILYEMNPDTMIYPASMTKVMTCLLALEKGTLTDTVTVSASALAEIGDPSNISFLKEGEQLTLENLLYCMMLPSANEAANAIAEHISGTIPDFVALMNQRAAELGCTGTHFANPHGLHDASHYTTVRDLSRITLTALENNAFRAICGTVSHTVPATNLSAARTLNTSNKLLVHSNGVDYYDPRVTGVKTGFTTPAGRCLVATAESGTLSLLTVVCGCDTTILPSGDLRLECFTETKKLLDYGFDSYVYVRLLETLNPVTEIPVLNSAGSGTVSLCPAAELHALMPADYDPEKVDTFVSLNAENVDAPVSAGTELGTLMLSYGDEILGTVPLITITGVSRAETFIPESRETASFRFILLMVCLEALLLIALIVTVIVLIRRIRRKKAHKEENISELYEKE